MVLNLDKLYSTNIWWRWNKRFQDTLARYSQVIETPQGCIEYALIDHAHHAADRIPKAKKNYKPTRIPPPRARQRL